MLKNQNSSTNLLQMINFKLYLRPTKSADGKCSVMIYVNAPDRSGYLQTGIKIPATAWNPEELIVRQGYENAAELNMILKQALGKVNNIIIMYRLEEKPLTFELLKAAYIADESSANFISWCRTEINKRKDEGLSESSIEMHHSVVNTFAAFCKGTMPFYNMTESTLAKYDKWCIQSGKAVNTVHKHMKTLKTYCRRAVTAGLIKTSPFETFRIRKEKTIPDCLSEYQLDKLFNIYKRSELAPPQQNALRAFLFSCCTGLRISDLRRITHGNIQRHILSFKMWKTRNTSPMKVKIPLTTTAQRLIRDTGREYGIIFELPASEKALSAHLKKAMALLDDGSLAHFHAARHTFATHYLRKNKGDIVTLKTLMGHSKIEQTMVYLTLDDNWLSEGMRNFGEWL